ncbi:MAG TPA: flagellar motor switch protein FliM [Alphaproteobacteria bacterium]|nr:flagellar motor switch protein FliM [Alphaproteobacteria bacterium]
MGTEEANNQDQAMAAMMAEMDKDPADKNGENLVPAEGDTLSQDEIDSLLGFGDASMMPKTGVEALISRVRDNYEKFPMLEVIFDRFSRSIQTSMRSFTGENCDISIENITSLRFEDYLNTIPLPTMISIYQAVEWENVGIITIESSLIYELVDILLGGGSNKKTNAFRVEGRPFTIIEQDMMKTFTRLILDEMTQSFTPITTISYRFERLETNPRFATITRPANPVVIVSCRIEFDGRGGKIDIVFPYATLEPVKDLLTQMFSGESFGSDSSWESFLTNELKTTRVNLSARLNDKTITLKELAELKVGSTLVMENFPDDDIDVSCNGVNIFKGKIGSYGDNVAISVTDAKAIKELV